MKKIYIILTYTGTFLSKIIKLYTRDEFSHVSLALDLELKQMYSFGRLNAYNPFVGGFVHEYIDRGTFKRFINTRARIIEINIDENQYLKLQNIIKEIELRKQEYKFNTLGLFAVGFKIKIRRKNSFYCAEFIKYLIEKSNINIELPELIRPESFKDIPSANEIYKGLLREYKVYETTEGGKEMKLLFQAIIKFILGIIMFATLLFLPAETFNYWNAWLLIGLLFVPMFFVGLILWFKDKELLRKRLNGKEKENEQKYVILMTLVIFISGFIVAGLDFKYGWSNMSLRLDYIRLSNSYFCIFTLYRSNERKHLSFTYY